MTAIAGAGDPRRLTISVEYEVWKINGWSGYANAATLERALEKMAPDAPADKVRAAAEVLEGILGFGEEAS